MDWFKDITGFAEGPYEETRSRISVDGNAIINVETGRRTSFGLLGTPDLARLRQYGVDRCENRPNQLRIVRGDIRDFYADPANAGALFQVASQFNLLEMMSPAVAPEDGVTRYVRDLTQGPVSAMAAGAALIYRNYLMPVAGKYGQTEDRQFNAMKDFQKALPTGLCQLTDRPEIYRNGYLLFGQPEIIAFNHWAESLDEDGRQRLKSLIRYGVHRNVQVSLPSAGHKVSQIFCSALPVAYCDAPFWLYRGLASMILEAAYEATILAGTVNRAVHGSSRVFLTFLGGGAFGNAEEWIFNGMKEALKRTAGAGLDLRLVCYGTTPISVERFVSELWSEGLISADTLGT